MLQSDVSAWAVVVMLPSRMQVGLLFHRQHMHVVTGLVGDQQYTPAASPLVRIRQRLSPVGDADSGGGCTGVLPTYLCHSAPAALRASPKAAHRRVGYRLGWDGKHSCSIQRSRITLGWHAPLRNGSCGFGFFISSACMYAGTCLAVAHAQPPVGPASLFSHQRGGGG